MDLSNLTPAEGSVKSKGRELVEVKVLVEVELLQEVIKELSQDLGIQER